jgi:hypothetical protein
MSEDGSVCTIGSETWFVTLTEKHMLGVFENRVLRKLFRRKRKEETVQNEEIYILYPPDFISVIKSRCLGHVAHVGKTTHAYKYCWKT